MRFTKAYRADLPGADLQPTDVVRRDLRADDVAVRITHCGVCHSDLHALHAETAGFPLVPGHEFVGEVTEIGAAVSDFVVGDPVAVGNIVDSCGTCTMCVASQQNYCHEFPTLTYGGTDRLDGSTTLGAFSSEYVVRDRFVYHRPSGLDPAAVAPLMCAGVTVWEPLRARGVSHGTTVGVVGLGGLGHLAVKMAHALGARVTVFTTTAAKADDALELGADQVVLSTDADAMAACRNSLDVVIDTVSAPHALEPYLHAVAVDGILYSVGDLGPVTVDTMALLAGRKQLSSSGSGGRNSTQEMLDFCGVHGIVADVEVLPSRQVMTALDRLAKGDVRYRFVLDLADL